MVIIIIVVTIIFIIGMWKIYNLIMEEGEPKVEMDVCDLCSKYVPRDTIVSVDTGDCGCPSDLIYVCRKCKKAVDNAEM